MQDPVGDARLGGDGPTGQTGVVERVKGQRAEGERARQLYQQAGAWWDQLLRKLRGQARPGQACHFWSPLNATSSSRCTQSRRQAGTETTPASRKRPSWFLKSLDADELDRLLASILTYADDSFDTMLEIRFGTAIRREWAERVKRGESLANLQAFAHLADKPD